MNLEAGDPSVAGLTKMFEITSHQWEENPVESSKLLESGSFVKSIPLVNCVALHNLRDNQLVRFRGMIQDMYDPELFLEKYEIRNTADGTTAVLSGRYKDVLPYGLNEEFVEHSKHNVNAERQTLYCVSIPGVNAWVLEHERSECGTLPRACKTTCESSVKKRGLEEDFKAVCSMSGDSAQPPALNGDAAAVPEAKRPCADTPVPAAEKEELNLNFPLPGANNKACIVKVYDTAVDHFALNQLVEVVGFLSMEPLVDVGCDDDDVTPDVEMTAHNPPPSLVPRVHAVHVRELDHCNPLVPSPHAHTADELVTIKSAYDELRLVFTQLLLGDQLAADFLICHLISTVYLRRDVLALGQFSVNLYNVPPGGDYTRQLYDVVASVVAASHFLPMTLDNLNTSTFVPRKDYATNRLSSGMLQLSANTHLVLDETALQAGQLNSTGVHNMAALKTVITQQKLDYDFKFYPLEFQTNLPVLVLSEGKSLLPCDACVGLDPDPACVDTIREIFQAARHYLTDAVLRRVRVYLTAVRHAEFHISDEMQQAVQTDFVQMRSEDAKISPSDLHSLLVLARLVSLSRCESSLKPESWQRALQMDQQRRERATRRPFAS